MMNEIETLRSMQRLRNPERIFGKLDIFFPVLKPRDQPMRVPFLEIASVREVHIRRNQALAGRSFQMEFIPVGGDHPQLVLLRQAFHGGPAQKAF
jgi:hypothetical protein